MRLVAFPEPDPGMRHLGVRGLLSPLPAQVVEVPLGGSAGEPDPLEWLEGGRDGLTGAPAPELVTADPGPKHDPEIREAAAFDHAAEQRRDILGPAHVPHPPDPRNHMIP
jgi:hypothetical protein